MTYGISFTRRFIKSENRPRTRRRNQLETDLRRISTIAINGKTSSPNTKRTVRNPRDRYSIYTWWLPGGNLIPTKPGISMIVSTSIPSTIALQLG